MHLLRNIVDTYKNINVLQEVKSFQNWSQYSHWALTSKTILKCSCYAKGINYLKE